jgi:hypothetical protein
VTSALFSTWPRYGSSASRSRNRKSASKPGKSLLPVHDSPLMMLPAERGRSASASSPTETTRSPPAPDRTRTSRCRR